MGVRGRALLCVLLLSACYDPDLSKVQYTCDDKDPVCPDGQVCTSGKCQDPKGQEDMTGPAASGCASKRGTNVGMSMGAGIYACPGTFNAGQDKQLCADGYEICQDGAGVNADGCGTKGFFGTKSLAHRQPLMSPSDATCGAGKSGEMNLIMGCGQLNGSYTLKNACASLKLALDCFGIFPCDGNIDEVKNPDSNSGVLCCKHAG